MKPTVKIKSTKIIIASVFLTIGLSLAAVVYLDLNIWRILKMKLSAFYAVMASLSVGLASSCGKSSNTGSEPAPTATPTLAREQIVPTPTAGRDTVELADEPEEPPPQYNLDWDEASWVQPAVYPPNTIEGFSNDREPQPWEKDYREVVNVTLPKAMLGTWKMTAIDVADDQVVAMTDADVRFALNKTVRITQENIFFQDSVKPNFPVSTYAADMHWIELLGTAKTLNEDGMPGPNYSKGRRYYIQPILNLCQDKHGKNLQYENVYAAREINLSYATGDVELPNSFYVIDNQTLVGDNGGVLFCMKRVKQPGDQK